jgi:hypothetical protein
MLGGVCCYMGCSFNGINKIQGLLFFNAGELMKHKIIWVIEFS